jgi:hypothetical protein
VGSIGIELYKKNPNITAQDILKGIKKAGDRLNIKDYAIY